MDRGITKENLLGILPVALTGDASVAALADAAAEGLADRREEIRRVLIAAGIDELPEAVLDILARDFKVDWWDPEYSVEEKRRTLKGSWRVHRTLGTKAAVETAISAIYPRTSVEEWWEYGGEPYHFRLRINITEDEMDSRRQRRVLERLNYYKNLRSHLDSVGYFFEAAPARADATGAYTGRRVQQGARLPIPPDIGPPGGRGTAYAQGAGVGQRSTLFSAPIDTQTGAAGAGGGVSALAGLCSRRYTMTAAVRTPTPERFGASAGAGVGGLNACQRITIHPTQGPPHEPSASGSRGERTNNGMQWMSGGQPDETERSL